MSLKYRFLNGSFHVLHLGVMAFIATGWIFQETRGAHILFVLGTLGTWLALGYCPITRWHWDLRQSAGLPRPLSPYIPFLAEILLGRPVDTKRIDRNVVVSTLLIALISLILNAKEYFKP